jgi:hypothetical protein
VETLGRFGGDEAFVFAEKRVSISIFETKAQ